jgi:hypothetical protein
MTSSEIELVTKRDLSQGPLPYKDAHWLQTNKGANEDLIPDLGMYFSCIVGFASTASRLDQRDYEQLQRYGPSLREDFFEQFPAHRPQKANINELETPQLDQQLRIANEVRLALLPIIEELLAREAKETT